LRSIKATTARFGASMAALRQPGRRIISNASGGG
jgi:hypothetical protein